MKEYGFVPSTKGNRKRMVPVCRLLPAHKKTATKTGMILQLRCTISRGIGGMILPVVVPVVPIGIS